MGYPAPPEPPHRELQGEGANYESGVADYFELDKDNIDPDVVNKRAVIDYLWDQWEHHNISYQELAEACGDASFRIDQWIDGEEDWEAVVERVNESL